MLGSGNKCSDGDRDCKTSIDGHNWDFWTGITSGARLTKATLAVAKRLHEGEAEYTKAT